MPTLINESFFVRDINIPNSRTNPVKEKLLSFIAKYEPQCLKEILGYNLYKVLTTENSQRITDLKEGKEYINDYGITKKWEGFIHDTDQSLIAYYIYYYYQEESISLTTGKGTAKPIQESAETVSPAEKMINSWNCMSNEVSQLLNFLWFNKSTYPEFENCDFTRVATNYRKNSLFGF